MANFTSLESLFDYIQDSVNEVLESDVTELVEDTMIDSIQTKVYNVYTPTVYNRRGEDGGLLDKRNISTVVSSNGQLTSTNVTIANSVIYRGSYGKAYSSKNIGGLLTPIIVSGIGYDFQNSAKAYSQPRNFITETKIQLSNGNKIKRTISTGLKKNGIKVK